MISVSACCFDQTLESESVIHMKRIFDVHGGNKSLSQWGSWAYLMREKGVLFDLDGPQPPAGWQLLKPLFVWGGWPLSATIVSAYISYLDASGRGGRLYPLTSAERTMH